VPVAFDVGFGFFLALMAGLAVFVVRFAIREGKRRAPAQRPPGVADELDEPSAATLVDDTDERRDG
jgi:uncharacterized membrane protein YedE/YeeE